MFRNGYNVTIVLKIVPYATKTTLYRMQQNIKLFR